MNVEDVLNAPTSELTDDTASSSSPAGIQLPPFRISTLPHLPAPPASAGDQEDGMQIDPDEALEYPPPDSPSAFQTRFRATPSSKGAANEDPRRVRSSSLTERPASSATPGRSNAPPARPPLGLAKILQDPDEPDAYRRPQDHPDNVLPRPTYFGHSDGTGDYDATYGDPSSSTSRPRRSSSPSASRKGRHASKQRYSPYPLSSEGSAEGSRTVSPNALSSPPQAEAELRPVVSAPSAAYARPSYSTSHPWSIRRSEVAMIQTGGVVKGWAIGTVGAASAPSAAPNAPEATGMGAYNVSFADEDGPKYRWAPPVLQEGGNPHDSKKRRRRRHTQANPPGYAVLSIEGVSRQSAASVPGSPDSENKITRHLSDCSASTSTFQLEEDRMAVDGPGTRTRSQSTGDETAGGKASVVYRCDREDCGSTFDTATAFRDHMRWHNSRYPCNEPNCGKVFTRENDLRRHSTIHKGERKYACPKCGKPFNRKDAMERHRRSCREAEMSWAKLKCVNCGGMFEKKFQLEQHAESCRWSTLNSQPGPSRGSSTTAPAPATPSESARKPGRPPSSSSTSPRMDAVSARMASTTLHAAIFDEESEVDELESDEEVPKPSQRNDDTGEDVREQPQDEKAVSDVESELEYI